MTHRRLDEPRILGKTPALLRCVDTVRRVAQTDVNVLLLGETGTGKELMARAVAYYSSRSASPFVAVNCAALNPNLIESELFGHEAGAFTGATRRSIGRLERASGGTLFLDEIGELPLSAQAKLLRALQEHVVERVGSTEAVPIDLRLVAATNRDLRETVDTGAFRRDLYYRLDVVTLELPPLRNRPLDIPALVEHFIATAQQRMRRRGIQLTDIAMQHLQQYSWPGNVRELENVCTRLVALADDDMQIGPSQLRLERGTPPKSSAIREADLREILDFCEAELVRRSLALYSDNRTHAARALGISRQALQQKIQKARAASSARSKVAA